MLLFIGGISILSLLSFNYLNSNNNDAIDALNKRQILRWEKLIQETENLKYFINKEGHVIQSAYQRIFIRHRRNKS